MLEVSKFSKSKNLAIGVVAIAPYPLAMLAQLFFANQLAVEEVGLFAAFSLLLSFIFAATNWGGDKYLISKKDISVNEIDSVFSLEIIAAFSLYLISIIFFYNNVNNFLGLENPLSLWIAIGFCFCYHPLVRCKALLEKNTSYLAAYIPTLIANILGLSLGLTCLLYGMGFWSMVIWKISTYVIEVIILFLTAPLIPRIKFKFSNKLSIFTFCAPIFGGGLIGFIGTNVDYYLVTTFMSKKELGLYWLAFSLSSILIVVRDVISRLILPVLSKQETNEQKIKIFDRLNGAIQLFGVFSAILVTFWSKYFFTYILGQKWEASATIFVILYYAAVFKFVGGTSVMLLFSVMKTRLALNTSLITVFLLTPVTYFAIKYGGINAVAKGVLVTTVVLWLIVFETSVRKLCGKGFCYYLSYLSVNIAILYFLSFLEINKSGGFMFSVVGTLLCVLFAVATFPINNVIKRTGF